MAVCDRLKQLMSRFLRAGPSLEAHRAKVAWEEVCRPKEEGWFGLKRVVEWNETAMLKHA